MASVEDELTRMTGTECTPLSTGRGGPKGLASVQDELTSYRIID